MESAALPNPLSFFLALFCVALSVPLRRCLLTERLRQASPNTVVHFVKKSCNARTSLAFVETSGVLAASACLLQPLWTETKTLTKLFEVEFKDFFL